MPLKDVVQEAQKEARMWCSMEKLNIIRHQSLILFLHQLVSLIGFKKSYKLNKIIKIEI